MDRQSNAAPVIIKRRKVTKAGEAHHGGAWKVAYADFVTAMMAFFLLMWLLNATTETQRSGLADYFSPTIAISRVSGGGDGALGGDDLMAEDSLAQSMRGGSFLESGASPPATGRIVGSAGRAMLDGEEELARIEAQLQGLRGETIDSELALRHVVTRLTDEGLIVEMFDLPGQPLFELESTEPMPVLNMLASLLSEVFAPYGNGLAVEGHTRAYPVVLATNPVWDLSTVRAQEMRGLLEAHGLPSSRMQRVTGHADRRLASGDTSSRRNNRLEVILLRARH